VGILRLWALMIAILVQTFMGIVSDRSTLRWGRRRPFIFIGAVAEVCVLALIGLTAGLEGMTGLWVLFALYVFSMISSNIGHAATQGLIPDLAPEEMRGRFSGVKTLFDLPLPVIFVSFVIGKLVASGNLWGALFALMAVLIVCMLIAMLAPETPQKQSPFPVDWQPFLRLVLMTAVFTVVILGVGALVSAATHLSLTQNRQVALGLTGLVGLIGMAFAVGFGVWISLRVGLGEAERRNPSFTWWVITRLAFLVGGTNLAGFFVYFLQERFPELAGTRAAGPAANIVMFVGVFILLSAGWPTGWARGC
jgi:MFS family permease